MDTIIALVCTIISIGYLRLAYTSFKEEFPDAN